MTYPLRIQIIRRIVDGLSIRWLKLNDWEASTKVAARYPQIFDILALRLTFVFEVIYMISINVMLKTLSLLPPFFALRIIHFLIRLRYCAKSCILKLANLVGFHNQPK
jgi:hypothetical protein